MSYNATFKKLDDGTWGVRTDGRCGYPSISDLKSGCTVTVQRKDGSVARDVELAEMIDTDGDCVSIWRAVEKKRI